MSDELQNISPPINTSDGVKTSAGAVQQTVICQTILLSDEPESNDAFGPHQRVADALTKLIRPENSKSISIGIEGSWGSGKTTVAKLLHKALSPESDITLITFDAWAHEGDPLRRTFIERITRHLQQKEWVDEKKWDERIEEIANRREVVSTKDTPVLSRLGKIVALSLLLVPAGGAFLTAAFRENFTFESTGVIAVKFLALFAIGLVLSLAPFFILLFTLGREDILGLLINKGTTEKRTESIKTANPTSIEFEETFNALMKEALDKEKRRIVLILDNLDRVDAKDALTLWATLQTFLQNRFDEKHPWHKRLWVLVLYDIKGLQTLWESANDNQNEVKAAASFIDKSFQIRFEVPPPVLSDWRNFLMSQLEKAFPNHSEAELHEVYRVLAIRLGKKYQLPTIRELKLYINQIGSIHRQWAAGEEIEKGKKRDNDAFPLSHIAYYVLLKRDGEDIVDKLSKHEIPSKEYQDLLGNEATESLAAIAFNVEVDIAQQLLFSNKIKDALGRGSSEALSKIAAVPKGFWEMLEQIVTTEWSGTESVKIADAALALERSNLLGKASQPSARTITKSMCDIASSVQSWTAFDERKAEGIKILIKWKSNLEPDSPKAEEFIMKLFRAISLGVRDYAMRSDSTPDAKVWLNHLSLSLTDLQPDIKSNALQLVVDTLSEAVRSEDPLQNRELELLFEVLSELHDYPDASLAVKSSLRSLSDEGYIGHQLRNGQSKTGSSVAWGLYILFRFSSKIDIASLSEVDGGNVATIISTLFTDPSGAVTETFTEILQRYKQLDLLFTVPSVAPAASPFVIPALNIVLKTPDSYSLFLGADALDRLEYVFNVIGWSEEENNALDNLVTRLLKEMNIVDRLTSSNFKISNARLYEHILRNSENPDVDTFKLWCLNGLKLISTDEWVDQLRGGGTLLTLAFTLKRLGAPIELGQKYLEALATNITTLISGLAPRVLPDYIENPVQLLGSIENSFRTTFRQQLYGLLLNTEGLHEIFYARYGPELREQLIYSSVGGDILDTFLPILERRDVNGLNWIKETLSESSSEIISKYSNENGLRKFRRAIQKDIDKGHLDPTLTSETHNVIRKIAGLLNIKPVSNGLIAFSSHREDGWEIYVMELGGDEPTRLTYNAVGSSAPIPPQSNQPVWSPDGKQIAFTSTVHGNFEIFLMNADGNNQIRLTDNPEGSQQPAWSPDGQRLAFVRGGGPKGEIYTIDIATKEERRLTNDDRQNEHPTWSPDSEKIAFHSVDVSDSFGIYIVNADGTDLKRITKEEYSNIHPAWSPDGQKIAYVSHRVAQLKGIYMMNPDGTNEELITGVEDGYAPAWSPDGKKIIYQRESGINGNLHIIDVDGNNRKQLTHGPGGNIDPSWQPLTED